MSWALGLAGVRKDDGKRNVYDDGKDVMVLDIPTSTPSATLSYLPTYVIWYWNLRGNENTKSFLQVSQCLFGDV